MFHLRIKQVVGFYWQNVGNNNNKNNNKNNLYLKCRPSQVFFKYFACKNQLPGFYISRALVENGLSKC